MYVNQVADVDIDAGVAMMNAMMGHILMITATHTHTVSRTYISADLGGLVVVVVGGGREHPPPTSVRFFFFLL